MDEVKAQQESLGIPHRNDVSDHAQKHAYNLMKAAEVARKVEHRQQQLHAQAEANKDNQQYVRTSLWNMPTTFGSDAMAASLGEATGQAHRGQLQNNGSHGGNTSGDARAHLPATTSTSNRVHQASGPSSRSTAPHASNRAHQAPGPSSRGTAPHLSNHTAASGGASSSRTPGMSLPTSLPPHLRVSAPTPARDILTPLSIKAKTSTKASPDSQAQAPAPRAEIPAAAKADKKTSPVSAAPAPLPADLPTRTARGSSVKVAAPEIPAAAKAETKTARIPAASPPPIADLPAARPSRATARGASVKIIRAPLPTAARASATTAPTDGPSVHFGTPSPAGVARGPATITRTNTTTEVHPPGQIRIPRGDAADFLPATLVTETAPAPSAPVDHFRHQQYMANAKIYAANPGPKSEKYHNMYPDRLPYLHQALKELADKETAAKKAEEVVKEKVVEEKPKEEIVEETVKEETAKTAPETKKTKKNKTPASPSTNATSDEWSEVSAPTPPAAPPAPHAPIHGKLVVTYLDSNSDYVGTATFNINAPVQANINITSQSNGYDPRVLKGALEDFAREMRLQDRNVRLVRGDDRLWQPQENDSDDDL